MRFCALSAVLLASLCITATVSAQCATTAAPGLETFDTLVPPATASVAGLSNPDVLPTGWAHGLLASTNLWRVWAGPTPSYTGNLPAGQTGPGADHTTGSATGVYLFTESSSTIPGDVAVVEVCFDVTTLSAPTLTFWYHMNGTSQGSLVVEQSTDGGLTWPTQLFSDSGDHGDVWVLADNIALTPDLNGQAHLRFVGTSGGSWRSDTAIDDVEISNVLYATNDGNGSVDINGVTGSVTSPAIVNLSTNPCGGTTGTLGASSQNAGSLYEIAISDQNLNAPGLPLLGDLLNLSIVSNISYFNGGAALKFVSMPAGPPPFTGPGGWSLSFTVSTTFDLSIQGVFTAPSTPSGIAFSQGTELHSVAGSSITSFSGPTTATGDDSSVMVDLTDPATCFSPTGVSFGGANFTQISVESNGRLVFGQSDSWWDPNVSWTLTNAPSFGIWGDLSPGTGISVSNPASGVLRVDYVNVTYFGQPAVTLAYTLEMDIPNQLFNIDNLLGIMPNPAPLGGGDDLWMGISIGNLGPATDPGATIFLAGSVGSTVLATDSLYDFFDHSTGVSGLPNSLTPGTLNKVEFAAFPGGFAWTGS